MLCWNSACLMRPVSLGSVQIEHVCCRSWNTCCLLVLWSRFIAALIIPIYVDTSFMMIGALKRKLSKKDKTGDEVDVRLRRGLPWRLLIQVVAASTAELVEDLPHEFHKWWCFQIAWHHSCRRARGWVVVLGPSGDHAPLTIFAGISGAYDIVFFFFACRGSPKTSAVRFLRWLGGEMRRWISKPTVFESQWHLIWYMPVITLFWITFCPWARDLNHHPALALVRAFPHHLSRRRSGLSRSATFASPWPARGAPCSARTFSPASPTRRQASTPNQGATAAPPPREADRTLRWTPQAAILMNPKVSNPVGWMATPSAPSTRRSPFLGLRPRRPSRR